MRLTLRTRKRRVVALAQVQALGTVKVLLRKYKLEVAILPFRGLFRESVRSQKPEVTSQAKNRVIALEQQQISSHLKNFCENYASQEEQRIMKVIELIFVAPWVFVIAVASIDVLREFWMDLRSYLVCGDYRGGLRLPTLRQLLILICITTRCGSPAIFLSSLIP